MLKRDKRQYLKKPGMSGAAKRLGISYGHARRVWLGEREAPDTLRRLRELIGESNHHRTAQKT
jgi:hypothetical protein